SAGRPARRTAPPAARPPHPVEPHLAVRHPSPTPGRGEHVRARWETALPAADQLALFSYSSSVRAAMMKSLMCSPPTACVHHSTSTRPHSLTIEGWWPTFSASSPTLLVKARAAWKSLNSYVRSTRRMPPREVSRQPGTCLCYSSTSASVAGCSPSPTGAIFMSFSDLPFCELPVRTPSSYQQ